MAKINGKEVQFVGTARWNQMYGGLEGAMYIAEALKALAKKPVDMLVFETKGETMSIRSAGYDLATDSKLDETTVIATFESLPTDTFWLKIDDYCDHYVATFLFPDEY
jgi:hypothetical protein